MTATNGDEMKRLTLVPLGVLVLGGCAVTPSVDYNLISLSEPRPLSSSEFDSYFLQGSKVVIAAKSDDVTVTSTPTESEAYKLALEHDDPFWASTTLDISKMANTDLVQQIGVSVTDYRVDYINAAAQVITTLAPYAAAGVTPSQSLDRGQLPLELDLVALLKDETANDRGARALAVDRHDIEVDLGPVPPDAIAFSQDAFPKRGAHSYFYSACRTLTVTYRPSVNAPLTSQTVKVSDPHFLQAVRFPTQGSITAQSECGVSVSTQKASVSTTPEVIQALTTQGDAIAKALEAANSAGSSKRK